MPELEFPVVKGRRFTYPTEPLCPWCQQNKVLEPHSMAILNAGALQPQPDGSSSMATEARAFFTLLWHGAHTDMNGTGQDPDISAQVEIADDVHQGQFDLYFCSTTCLRNFLNACVDELESQIALQKKRNTP